MANKRVLFLAASPWDKARVGFDAEYRKIKQALRQANLRDQFDFDLSLAVALLHKSNLFQASPTPKQFYAIATVMGVPR